MKTKFMLSVANLAILLVMACYMNPVIAATSGPGPVYCLNPFVNIAFMLNPASRIVYDHYKYEGLLDAPDVVKGFATDAVNVSDQGSGPTVAYYGSLLGIYSGFLSEISALTILVTDVSQVGNDVTVSVNISDPPLPIAHVVESFVVNSNNLIEIETDVFYPLSTFSIPRYAFPCQQFII